MQSENQGKIAVFSAQEKQRAHRNVSRDLKADYEGISTCK